VTLEMRPTSNTTIELYDESGRVGHLILLTRELDDEWDDDLDVEGWHGSLNANGPESSTGGHTTAAEAFAALLPAYDKMLERRAYLQTYEARVDKVQRGKRTISIPMGGQPRRG
jgi:hypothetical protein